ncbi:MAG: OmpA family protein [Desulfuromonadales bacterium]|nr:OmpA family protein [Desulfuromonadales bacterium]
MNGWMKFFTGCALIALVSACAPVPQPPLQPLTAPAVNSGGKAAKIDNFQIIIDSSLSMEEGGKYFITARDIASRINQGIPADLTYNSGLRTFGHNSYQSKNPTNLIYGMTRHDRQTFHDRLGTIQYIGGTSPLAAALNAATQDLKTAGGKSAIIVISDGLDMDNAPAAAQQAKEQLGDNLCIYTIAVGNQRNSMGHKVLEKVAQAGQCGFATTAANLADAGAMAQFVATVFLTEPAPKPAPAPVVLDSDGDGVPDHLDKCPNTPRGVAVDTQGCPLDSDGDGVADYLDKCPGTPAGVRVDTDGCPTVLSLRINFGFDSANVSTEFDSELAKAAACISNYPGHEVALIGHTDSAGPEAYNQTLSEQRAVAVKNALVERFNVPAAKMVARGMGEEKPVADNKTEEGRALNRRVDVACGYAVQ